MVKLTLTLTVLFKSWSCSGSLHSLALLAFRCSITDGLSISNTCRFSIESEHFLIQSLFPFSKVHIILLITVAAFLISSFKFSCSFEEGLLYTELVVQHLVSVVETEDLLVRLLHPLVQVSNEFRILNYLLCFISQSVCSHRLYLWLWLSFPIAYELL